MTVQELMESIYTRLAELAKSNKDDKELQDEMNGVEEVIDQLVAEGAIRREQTV